MVSYRTAITGSCTNPFRTSDHRRCGEHNHTITIPTREARTRLLIRRLLLHVLAVPSVRQSNGKQNKNYTVAARSAWIFMTNRPPRQNIWHCDPRIIDPIMSSSCDDPPFYWGTPVIGNGF
ncbi:hypothetical protein AVEN_188792-1 [Araneus ventricosus]|uniref:Uncharacterized protein n=1 Tax=Araneus ventricosus TaxID=182803 RepID=A0A4Y1ZNN8_ARAVE|nr:hypothetical protein AVEN_188792-1 [Araneus ventricosus]